MIKLNKKVRNTIKNVLKFSPYLVYEKFIIKKRKSKCKLDQKRLLNTYCKNNDIKKMQIGCGSNILEGWLNTDIKYNDQIAFLDAGSKFPIESDTFDYIYSEHLFEHLSVRQQLNMLEESYRVLKKGGVMRIATPTLDFLFDLYSNPNTSQNKYYVNWATENISHLHVINNSIEATEEHYCFVINNFFRAWGHQMIHNYSSISKLALQCGYCDVKKCKVGESDFMVLRNIERHGTIIPEEINLIETMVVEIIK